MKNIILIGFMGSGKSTLAEKIAERLTWEAIEMDQLVLNKSSYNSIAKIFEQEGEVSFREKEIAVAKELSTKKNIVVSTGGGLVVNKIGIDYLRQNGVAFYLKTSFSEIEKRLKGDTIRPLFADRKNAKKLYKLREPLYSAYADVIIDEHNMTITDVVDAIIKEIK